MDSLFSKLDFNTNEKEVYLAILESGKITPKRVSELTKINRTTVYSIANKLQNMGLIAQDLGQRINYLVAEPPAKLIAIYEKDEEECKKKKNIAKQLAHLLEHTRSNNTYSVPRIKFIEEDNLKDYLYKQYSVWRESVVLYNNTWWGFHDDSFTKKYWKWIDWCWKNSEKSLKVRFFTNNSTSEQKMREMYPERQIKLLPKNINFDSSFWVVGEYILMVQTREHPHYLIEIHDTVLARNQRELFKGLWSLAPSPMT